MIKYILPIFYSFYSYCLTKIRIPLFFVMNIGIIWSSGYNFERSQQTAEYIIISILLAILFDLLITYKKEIWTYLTTDEDDDYL